MLIMVIRNTRNGRGRRKRLLVFFYRVCMLLLGRQSGRLKSRLGSAIKTCSLQRVNSGLKEERSGFRRGAPFDQCLRLKVILLIALRVFKTVQQLIPNCISKRKNEKETRTDHFNDPSLKAE